MLRLVIAPKACPCNKCVQLRRKPSAITFTIIPRLPNLVSFDNIEAALWSRPPVDMYSILGHDVLHFLFGFVLFLLVLFWGLVVGSLVTGPDPCLVGLDWGRLLVVWLWP